MAGAKLIVLYPSPRDVRAFEQVYTQDHAPMVTPQTFEGIKKFVASKVVGTPDGSAATLYRIAELHFPSMEVLQAAAASAPAQKAVCARRLNLEWREAHLPRGRRRGEDLLGNPATA